MNHTDDERYMRRALQLAYKGLPYAFPNPMVGAVIVDADGNIIGEGYHRKCGEAHAEVNAIASVREPEKLKSATMYVTLEPCAHYGRTGPCAKLIIEKGIPNVVVGIRDPFEKVDGRGIEMLREAGVNVKVGVLEEDCRKLNAIFFTAHTQHRPYIVLKWAQSADGYIDVHREEGADAARISSDLTSAFTHRIRAVCDGILVGSETVLADNPSLTNRLWPGKSPRPIILDRRGRTPIDARIMQYNPLIINADQSLETTMRQLYDMGMTIILVEGGAKVLNAFIEAGLWDIARVETGPVRFDDYGKVKAPKIADHEPTKTVEFEGQTVKYYSKNPLIDVKNL